MIHTHQHRTAWEVVLQTIRLSRLLTLKVTCLGQGVPSNFPRTHVQHPWICSLVFAGFGNNKNGAVAEICMEVAKQPVRESTLGVFVVPLGGSLGKPGRSLPCWRLPLDESAGAFCMLVSQLQPLAFYSRRVARVAPGPIWTLFGAPELTVLLEVRTR